MNLIIGGTGFIGSYLSETLAKKYPLVCVSRHAVQNSGSNIQLDVNNQNQLLELIHDIKIKNIIFAAGNSNPKYSIENILADAKNTILPLLSTLEVVGQTDVESFIYFSSVAVYGNTKVRHVAEEHHVEPVSPYGISKLTCEKYIQQVCLGNNISYGIFRLAQIYGFNQKRGAIANFIKSIRTNQPIKINGDGKQKFDFIHNSDVASAVEKWLGNKKSGIFNLGTGIGSSILDIIEHFTTLLGESPMLEYSPKISGEILGIVTNSQKLEKSIGWKATIGLEKGLEKILKKENLL